MSVDKTKKWVWKINVKGSGIGWNQNPASLYMPNLHLVPHIWQASTLLNVTNDNVYVPCSMSTFSLLLFSEGPQPPLWLDLAGYRYWQCDSRSSYDLALMHVETTITPQRNHVRLGNSRYWIAHGTPFHMKKADVNIGGALNNSQCQLCTCWVPWGRQAHIHQVIIAEYVTKPPTCRVLLSSIVLIPLEDETLSFRNSKTTIKTCQAILKSY